MRSNGEGDAVSGCSAGADTLAGETIDHVQRVLQLHEDVRAQFFIVEEKLTTARAVARGSFEPFANGAHDFCDDDEPVEPVIGPPVAVPRVPKRSRLFLATLACAGLAITTGLIVSLHAATSQVPVHPASATSTTEPAALAVDAETGSTANTAISAAATPGAAQDLGQTIYAARFSKASAAERTCLARAVYYEARGEAMDGQIAVVQVILNRARSKQWPSTICGVVNQGAERGEKCQFSFACFKHLTEPNGDMWEQAKSVAEEALAGRGWFREFTEATHYHTTGVAPVWRLGLVEISTIGTHVFYRENEGLRANAADAPAYQAAVSVEAVRAKVAAVAAITKAARPKLPAGEPNSTQAALSPPKKPAPRAESEWKASVFEH